MHEAHCKIIVVILLYIRKDISEVNVLSLQEAAWMP